MYRHMGASVSGRLLRSKEQDKSLEATHYPAYRTLTLSTRRHEDVLPLPEEVHSG